MVEEIKGVESKLLNWALLLVAGWVLTACNERPVFDQSVEIPDMSWKREERVKLEFQIDDTVSQHNFFLNVRNTERFPYRNLYVFITTVFPNGKKSVDTVGCMLADKSGRWLGDGNGFLFDNSSIANRVMYKYNRRFPLTGEYTVYIEQAMRDSALKGVMNVGLRIEQANGKGKS